MELQILRGWRRIGAAAGAVWAVPVLILGLPGPSGPSDAELLAVQLPGSVVLCAMGAVLGVAFGNVAGLVTIGLERRDVATTNVSYAVTGALLVSAMPALTMVLTVAVGQIEGELLAVLLPLVVVGAGIGAWVGVDLRANVRLDRQVEPDVAPSMAVDSEDEAFDEDELFDELEWDGPDESAERQVARDRSGTAVPMPIATRSIPPILRSRRRVEAEATTVPEKVSLWGVVGSTLGALAVLAAIVLLALIGVVVMFLLTFGS